MMSCVGRGSLVVERFMAVSVHCRVNWSGMLINSDFTWKDTSIRSSGVCIVLMALMKFSVDCILCLYSAVRGFSMVVKYLESSYVGDPQNETMSRMGMLGLCSFGSPYRFGDCGTEHFSRKYCGLLITSVCLSENIFLLSFRWSVGVGSRVSTS